MATVLELGQIAGPPGRWLHKGMYNASSLPVFIFVFLQKTPRFGLETLAPSSREATARARAPRSKRRLEPRCTGSSSRLDGVQGSHM